jgi:hypothetical protein
MLDATVQGPEMQISSSTGAVGLVMDRSGFFMQLVKQPQSILTRGIVMVRTPPSAGS